MTILANAHTEDFLTDENEGVIGPYLLLVATGAMAVFFLFA